MRCSLLVAAVPLALANLAVVLPGRAPDPAVQAGPPGRTVPADRGEAPVAADPLAELSFLAGHWRAELGPAPGAMLVEETWLPPAGGNMTAVFRMVAEGTGPTLFEIVTIDAGPNGPELRLRHFNPGLVPWAADAKGPLHLPGCVVTTDGATSRVVFTPAAGGEAAVTSIAYERTGERLVATVSMPDGERFVIPFERIDAR